MSKELKSILIEGGVVMTRYWKKRLWEEYGVIVKKIRHIYNPFTSWGFLSENYIVYYWTGSSAGSLLANYDIIFHSPEEIIKFLEEQKKITTY